MNNFAALIDLDVIKLSGGLVILISINILLGAVSSLFEKEFDLRKLLQGIIKAVIIIFCFSAVYIVGAMNKAYLSLDLQTGDPIDVMDAIHCMLLTGYYMYGKQVITKMSGIIYNQPADAAHETPLYTPAQRNLDSIEMGLHNSTDKKNESSNVNTAN